MDKYEKIEKLQQLKQSGTLSETEFETQKQKILQEKNNKIGKVILILVCIIAIIIIVFFIINSKKSPLTSSSTSNNNGNSYSTTSNSSSNVEIGTKYNYVGNTSRKGYIVFNNGNSFNMETSEGILGMARTYKGNYTIQGNTITLTVTYDSFMENLKQSVESSNKSSQYNLRIKILEDGKLEFIDDDYGTFDKNYKQ